MPPTTTRFLLSSNPTALAACAPHIIVEAEYGDTCIEGSVLTLAHHGPRAGRPAPCSQGNQPAGYAKRAGLTEVVVGLSHIDLDTIGGCMGVLGVQPLALGFWAAAEFVDLNGVHRLGGWLGEVAYTPEAKTFILECLHAFWAFSEQNRVYPPRDGSVADVTDKVRAMVDVLVTILTPGSEGRDALIEAGRVFAAREAQLEAESFASLSGGVVVRRSKQFINHLYTHGAEVAGVVVGYNDETGAVTVSYEAGVPSGMPTARALVQARWGELAGGHDGIAGSPRGQKLSFEEAEAFAAHVRALLTRPQVSR